ncbi:hypothetical protein DN069_13630 [Streptacidiphilus pinicola]|uniref:Uncharacterized protein n=1 Tax=Streptacidiphilus pinicola TaxID=2219663 RepID=A0A2X0KDK6_9ACTN|nr:hypothetical protein [Streptacidiphilus pinicola]RAG85000.1 hypothetical protein DN069_13630 [Streptacidiphilus pinicola]
MDIEPITAGSACIFAAGSSIRLAYEWDARLGVETNVSNAHAAVTGALNEESDGVLVTLPGTADATVNALALATGDLLLGLLTVETGRSRAELRARIPRSDWRMVLGGQVLYPLAFSSCYGPDSSRYTFGRPGSFVMFQPQRAFASRHDPSVGKISDRARERIREAHRAAGRPFDLRLTLSPFECHKVVKPQHLGEHPVVWW